MEIPGLGPMERDKQFKTWYRSAPIAVPVLGNKMCRIVVEHYEEDGRKDDFHRAIANFLSADPSVLQDALPHLFEYYQDYEEEWKEYGSDYAPLTSPDEVLKHIHLGSEPMVARREYGDKGIYISLECGCDWEPEHGLQIVFKDGSFVNKVGPYDGHMTNSDAYGEDDDEDDRVYRRSRT